jgi:hypothetical protein
MRNLTSVVSVLGACALLGGCESISPMPPEGAQVDWHRDNERMHKLAVERFLFVAAKHGYLVQSAGDSLVVTEPSRASCTQNTVIQLRLVATQDSAIATASFQDKAMLHFDGGTPSYTARDIKCLEAIVQPAFAEWKSLVDAAK